MTPQEYLSERERVNGRTLGADGLFQFAADDVEPNVKLDPTVRVFVRQVNQVTESVGAARIMFDAVFVDSDTNEPILGEPITLPIELFMLASDDQ